MPLADGTLVAAPVEEDSPLIPSLLTLSDVYGTGYHAAIKASISPGPRSPSSVTAPSASWPSFPPRQLGAEQIILMGRHTARTDLGREFGATHVIAERGDDGIEKVRDLTGGDGTHVVIEAVGHMPAYEQAVGVVRPGGVISRVGVPQYDNAPVGFASLFGPNITLTGGPAPARAYIQTLMPGILAGQVNPGRVFDRELTLDQIPEGYQEMDSRQALKVLIRP